MEFIFILVVVLIVMVFVLPLVAMRRSSESMRHADALKGRVDFLQQEVAKLRAELKAGPGDTCTDGILRKSGDTGCA